MKKKYLISIFVAVTMVTGLLSGCAKKSENAKGGGQRTIRWMTVYGIPNAWVPLAQQYERENPGIKVEFDRISDRVSYNQKLTILTASDALPDLFDADADSILEEIASRGVLLDIDDLYRELGYDRMLDIGLNAPRLDNGKLYTINWTNNMEYFWYHKDLFAKAGITKTPETFDELLEVCQKLRDAGIVPIAVVGDSVWAAARYLAMIPFRLTGNTFIDNLRAGKAKVSDPIGIKAAEFLQKIAGYFQPGWPTAEYMSVLNIFLSGNAAIYNIGSWQHGSFVDENGELKDDYAFFYMPTLKGAVNGKTDMVAHPGTGTAIRKDKYDDQLKHFLKFMLDKFPEACFYGEKSFPAMSFDVDIDSLSNFERQILNDSNALTSAAKLWDVRLDAPTVALMHKEMVNLGMGVITPQQFAKLIDDSIARNLSK
jgi:raffinose/stachyose/melibiose transport system substrate-binding protein